MSTGFALLQWAGRNSFNFSTVSSERDASFPPFSIIESVARTPGPPAFVIIAIFGPVGRGCLARIDEQLNKSLISRK